MDLLEAKGMEILDPISIRAALRSEESINQMLDTVNNADLIVLAAPLYDDCQPTIVIKVMEIIAEKGVKGDKMLTVIVNSGFPEGHQNATPFPIYQKFTSRVGIKWGGALGIGAGEVMQGRHGKTLEEVGSASAKVREKLEFIAGTFAEGKSFPDETMDALPGYFYSRPMMWILSKMNGLSWWNTARKNGGKVKATPYA